MKLSFKTATKDLAKDGIDLGEMIGGAVLSKKFLDFSNLSFFKDGAAKSPDGWQAKAIKYQGGIKVLGALIGRTYVKNKHIKAILYGVGFEGGLNLVRQFTNKKDGSGNYVDQIGGNPDSERENIREGVAGEDSNYQDSVAGVGDDYTEYQEIN